MLDNSCETHTIRISVLRTTEIHSTQQLHVLLEIIECSTLFNRSLPSAGSDHTLCCYNVLLLLIVSVSKSLIVLIFSVAGMVLGSHLTWN